MAENRQGYGFCPVITKCICLRRTLWGTIRIFVNVGTSVNRIWTTSRILLQGKRLWWFFELQLLHHHGTSFPSISQCGGSMQSSTRQQTFLTRPLACLSIQIQTAMEHSNLVVLGKRYQWPLAAQNPPVISPSPTTKDLEPRVLSPGPVKAICAADRMEEPELRCCLHARCPGRHRSI